MFFPGLVNHSTSIFAVLCLLPTEPLFIDVSDIIKIIDSLKLNPFCWTENINSKLPKKHQTILLWIILFKQLLLFDIPPGDWTVGKVMALQRFGDGHCPMNDKPTSSTNIPRKILQHIVAPHLVGNLDSNSFFYTSSTRLPKKFLMRNLTVRPWVRLDFQSFR